METELKLKVAPALVSELRNHPLLTDMTQQQAVENDLHDTYYDAAEFTLWRNGLALRVRRQGENWTQTLKTASSGSAALHLRGEWESKLGGGEAINLAQVG